jgi:hypothetical protein
VLERGNVNNRARPPLFERLEDLKRHEPISSLGSLSRFATFTLLRPRTGAVR